MDFTTLIEDIERACDEIRPRIHFRFKEVREWAVLEKHWERLWVPGGGMFAPSAGAGSGRLSDPGTQ